MKSKIHIIGGGIIGLCSAWFLQEEGFDVTVIDKGPITEGTSLGNAGMIVPSHFVPLASPGVIAQGMKWMFNPKSPFFIRPRMNVDLFQWLWQFYKSCTPNNVNKSMSVLREYNELSRDLYGAFAQKEGFEFCFEKKGLLMLFQSEKQAKEEAHHAELSSQVGVSTILLNQDELKSLEPDIKINALGGLYFPDDAHLYPNLFISQLATELRKKGVEILENTEISEISASARKIDSISTSNNQKIAVDKVLFASGSWTALLLKKAGVKMHLQDGKGYSITLDNPILKPTIPTILSEAKVAITPLGNDLRIGGTLEISGLSPKINQKRLQGIIEALPKYYPEFDIERIKQNEVWHGFRPCTPDGIPYLGKVRSFDNTFIATGHGMMGMSLGPATGKIMAEIITDKLTCFDYSIMDKL